MKHKSVITNALKAMRYIIEPIPEGGIRFNEWQDLEKAHAELAAFVKDVPGGLETGLKNAVKPSYESPQGEWCLWCGEEKSAEGLLKAAQMLHSAVEEEQK